MTNNNSPNDSDEPETEIEEFIQECYRKGQMAVLDESHGPITTIPVHDEEDQ